MKPIAIIAAFLLTSVCAFAVENEDTENFCSYEMEQARAQRDLLRTPGVASGITQPETGLPMQFVVGLTNSLSNDKKAGLTIAVARRNCELYKKTTETQQQIQYALIDLDKKALNHRLDLIQYASGKLDELLGQNLKRVQTQNLARPMFYSLQASKFKLTEDKLGTQTKITALYVPSLSDMPVKLLITQKQNSEVETQKAIARLSRQSNWDVALAIGAHRQISTTTTVQGDSSTGVYGQVSVTYNLGAHAIDKHLDRMADAYGNWKLTQVGDVVRNAQILKQQVTDSISDEENALTGLREQEKEIEANLQLVAGVDTSAAVNFQNQLTADKLLLGVEIGDVTFRLEKLRTYLSENF